MHDVREAYGRPLDTVPARVELSRLHLDRSADPGPRIFLTCTRGGQSVTLNIMILVGRMR